MQKIKKLLLTLSLSDNNDDSESDDISDKDTPTHLSIGENKNASTLNVTFHPDAFLCNNISIYNEPPLNPSNNNYQSFILELKQYSYKISFNITISPKLCELGYVRVNTIQFLSEIQQFTPICISFSTQPKREYLYIPMTVSLPINQQRHDLFDDILTPTLIIIPSSPQLYRYKLCSSFLWRYQYVRIREFPSLKMDVIGEIPCDLSFEIIGYPICAILPNFYSLGTNNYNIINKSLNERKSLIDIKQWSVFENSYWIKLQPNVLKKLPLMQRCKDELKDYDSYNEYFAYKGYVIQQYLGHTVLKCIGPLVENSNPLNIPISFDTNNNLFIQQTKEETNVFDGFPIELISHIISFCDFEFVTNVLSLVSKEFYISSISPACYHTAIIPSNLIDKMLIKIELRKMLKLLCKCKHVDVYSLICEEHIDYKIDNETHTNCGDYKMEKYENIIEEFHLEFITKSILHRTLFNIFNFNTNLRVLKLTQCGNISAIALNYLPNNLQELCLMNTIINIKTWENLKKLSSLIITNRNVDNNNNFLKLIVETLPKQILKSMCIWDGQEDNIIIIKELIESHNNILNVFGIGGRICLYHPFSTIFTSLEAKAYPRLEIITVSCLATHEIIQLIKEFGYQLRILELFCPFVMDEQQDIYHWLLKDNNIELFCKSLIKLEILMCQGFPLHMKRYMINNKWKELKQQFIDKFMLYRNNSNVPIILFDFGIDLNKVSFWKQENINKYLIHNQKELELNFGNGI